MGLRTVGSTDQEAVVKWALKDNEAAFDLIYILGEVSQVWDDLIDGDKPVGSGSINRAFELSIIALPRNGFYKKNFDELQPLIEQAIFNWQDANEIESSKETALYPVSYALRDSLVDLVLRCAFIIGGRDWSKHVAIPVRKALFNEPLMNYIIDIGDKYVNR